MKMKANDTVDVKIYVLSEEGREDLFNPEIDLTVLTLDA